MHAACIQRRCTCAWPATVTSHVTYLQELELLIDIATGRAREHACVINVVVRGRRGLGQHVELGCNRGGAGQRRNRYHRGGGRRSGLAREGRQHRRLLGLRAYGQQQVRGSLGWVRGEGRHDVAHLVDAAHERGVAP
eukprot:352361-Chlamydomonas_euryale.AAC.5